MRALCVWVPVFGKQQHFECGCGSAIFTPQGRCIVPESNTACAEAPLAAIFIAESVFRSVDLCQAKIDLLLWFWPKRRVRRCCRHGERSRALMCDAGNPLFGRQVILDSLASFTVRHVISVPIAVLWLRALCCSDQGSRPHWHRSCKASKFSSKLLDIFFNAA